MRIYIGHSKKFNYIDDLYIPLRNDDFFKEHELLLPHEESSSSSNSRDFYKSIDLFIAECSDSGTGLGIELGWCYDDGVKIYCIYRSDKKLSSSIRCITNNIYDYKDSSEMVSLVKRIVEEEMNKDN